MYDFVNQKEYQCNFFLTAIWLAHDQLCAIIKEVASLAQY